MNTAKEIVELLSNQYKEDDYRVWEEEFFNACRDFLESNDNWNELLTLCRGYPVNVQAKTEYLLHVFRHETGETKFSKENLKMEGLAQLNDAFWSKDYRPDFDYRLDKLALRFGLQRGMMQDRFHQFMTTGMN